MLFFATGIMKGHLMKQKNHATGSSALLIILFMVAGLLSLLPSQAAEAQEVIIFEVTNTCPGYTPGDER